MLPNLCKNILILFNRRKDGPTKMSKWEVENLPRPVIVLYMNGQGIPLDILEDPLKPKGTCQHGLEYIALYDDEVWYWFKRVVFANITLLPIE